TFSTRMEIGVCDATSAAMPSVVTIASVAAAWLVAAIVIGPRAARIEDLLDVSASVPSSESLQVEQTLAARFHSPFAHYAILVARGLPSPTVEPGERALSALADSIAAAPGVTRVLSYADAHDSLFLGSKGTEADATFLVVGLKSATGKF